VLSIPISSRSVAEDRKEIAHEVVHLLNHLAHDIGESSHASRGSSPDSEFDELIIRIENGARGLDPQFVDVSTLKGALLKDVPSVKKLARSWANQLVAQYGIEQRSTHQPNALRAKALYERACVQCHGNEGRGNGKVAKFLSPQPANLRKIASDPDFSAFNIFNTIRFGIPGTAMPAFSGLSAPELWDLATLVKSLR